MEVTAPEYLLTLRTVARLLPRQNGEKRGSEGVLPRSIKQLLGPPLVLGGESGGLEVKNKCYMQATAAASHLSVDTPCSRECPETST